MDTSVVQFYPTLFVLATDVMDMLGDMVWERIRRRAEFAEDGTLICSLRGFYLLYKSISLSLSLSPPLPLPLPLPLMSMYACSFCHTDTTPVTPIYSCSVNFLTWRVIGIN